MSTKLLVLFKDVPDIFASGVAIFSSFPERLGQILHRVVVRTDVRQGDAVNSAEFPG